MATIDCESRTALRELIALLQELDERWLGPDWLLTSPADVAEGARCLMHLLQGGLYGYFEDDADHPVFRRIVSPERKFTGDNADAIYFDAPVRPDRVYRIRGNLCGAAYFSLTVEEGAGEGGLSSATNAVLNDESIDVGPDGAFEVIAGGAPRPRNWLALLPTATRITTRHYFEEESAAAADPTRVIPFEIEVVDRLPPPDAPSDESVAAGIRRVATFVRSRTLGMGKPGEREQPPFVSVVPNEFPSPVKPESLGAAAADAAYSMAPYVIGPDQALVITGRWPRCRFANVSLWNRHLMTFDYANRRASLNRRQTRLEEDGSFRMVLAHRDPGMPNWLDTEGRLFGLVFWRYMLPEGAIEAPRATVVPFAEVARLSHP
jgi:hypothetical protein